MKTRNLLLLAVTASVGLGIPATAQLFDSGSNGSMGALDVTSDLTLDLPPNGVFHYTTITVANGATLRFNRNALNTPVHLLASGDVVINGAIDVSGSAGNSVVGGSGGPGGFDGGKPGFGAGAPPGAGYGPGGGLPGQNLIGAGGAGGGAYATAPQFSDGNLNHGSVYGSALLVPLVGGSGGGGTDGSPGVGGAGGGGAILIASSTRITLSGTIRAYGWASSSSAVNDGSGGAVRLVAPVVAGSGTLYVYGRAGDNRAGLGRIRIDTIDRRGMALSTPAVTPSVGAFMTSFAPGNPKLDVIAAAGTVIPEGVAAPVTISLPFGSDPNRTITVQARNFNAVVPIDVVLTPDSGAVIKVQAQIDNAAANPATVTVPVTFPVNTPVAVNAWTR
jgi:hypothetical protein